MTIQLNPRARGLVGVRADAGDITTVIAELNTAFESFKAANDERLEGIDKKFEDVVQAEKVDRINASISELQRAHDAVVAQIAARRTGAAGVVADPVAAEHAQAFNAWFRKGPAAPAAAGLAELEVKAQLTTQSDPDGGYFVPEEMASEIDRVVGTVSALRDLSSVMTISTDTYKQIINMGGAASGWVGEQEPRPETATPALREMVFNVMEMYANPRSTQTLLDDGRVDIAAWLANEVSIEFAEKEAAAFVSGNGVQKPRGILAYPSVDNASYSWGNIGFVTTGAAADFATTDPANVLIDMFHALKSQYRQGASWLMSDATMARIRKFKDGQGNYLFAPPTVEQPFSALLGKRVAIDDNMPSIGANALPVAIANFSRAYLVVDRFGIRVLRDPYTSKPYVQFYTTKRVGGGVRNFEAIKLLKVAA